MKKQWTDGLTWNTYDGTNAWQVPGATGFDDIDTTEIGNRPFTASEQLNEFKEFTIRSSAIQEMIDGTFLNHGFMLKMDVEQNDAYSFDTGGTNQAQLVIVYQR